MKIFVCFTPLHILIAERIIEKENIKEYIFIYFTDVDSEKNRYYFDKLSNDSISSHYIILKKSIFKDLNIIYNLYKKINPYLKNKNTTYYSGKIKSSHVRILMYLTKYKDFITFDDGSGNISGAGYFYEKNENFLFKLFFTFLKKDLLYKNILNHNQKHYTIFHLPNVFKNKTFISLFKIDNHKEKKDNDKLVILLTNAFAEDQEMKLDDERILYKNIIDKYNVTSIIKHPREKEKKILSSNIKELKSLKIAEELIYELSLQYDITVIGIYSTSLLTLAKFENVKTINIHTELKKPVHHIMNILNDMNIRTYNV